MNLFYPAATRSLFAAAILSVVGLASFETRAQSSVESFYSGKQMKFIIRSATGGGYDLYSRLIGSHIVRHIPGKPTMLPQNMPGAGGLVAANYVGNLAPKDGTILTMLGQALPMDQALGFTPQLKTDLRDFGWLGHLGDSNMLTYVWHTSPTKTIADAKKRETTIAGTGAGSVSTWLPLVINNVIDTKFKMITGYGSVADVRLAMERGEVEGYGANPLASLMSVNPELLKENKIVVLVQMGIRKEDDLPNVPLLVDLASNPEERAVLEFITNAFAVGRPIGTTPGVPPDRLAALRKAFNDTMKDPAFIDAMTKAGSDLKPVYGEELEKIIANVINAPQSIKDKVKAAMPKR